MLVCYITKRAAIVSLKMPRAGVLHRKASSNRLSQNASCWCVTSQSEQQSSLSQNASCWWFTSQSEQQSSLSKCLMLVCYITKRAAIVSLKMPRAGVLYHKASSNRLSQNASCCCVTSQSEQQSSLSKCLMLVCYIAKRAAIVSLKMPHVGVLHRKASSNRLSQNASRWCVTSQSEQQSSLSKCLMLMCYIAKRAAIVSLSKCLMLVCYIAKRAAIVSLKMPLLVCYSCVTSQSEQQSSLSKCLSSKASSNRLSQNASRWCVTSQSEQQSSLSKCLVLVCYIAKRAAIVSLKMPRAGVLHHKASSNRLSQNASCCCVTSQSEQQSSLSKCLMLVCYIAKRAAIVSLKMPHVGVLHRKASSNRLSQNASHWCVTSQSEQQSSLSKCLMLLCYIAKRAAIVSLSKCLMLVCYIAKRAAIVSLKMPLLVCYITKRAAIVSLKMPHVGVLHRKASSNRLSQNASRWCVTSQSEQQSSLSKCLMLMRYIAKRAAIVSLSKCLMLVCYIAKRAAIVSLKMPLLVCYITKRAAIVSLKMPHVGVLHHKASSNRLSQNASRWCVTSQSEQQSSLSKCLVLVCYIAKRAAIVSLKMPRAGVLHHKASSNRLSQNASCCCVTSQSEQQSSLSKCLMLVCYIAKRAAIVSLKMPHVGVLHRKASSNRLSQNASRWCVTSQSEQQSSLSKCLMLVCYITKRAAIVSLKMPHVGVLHHKASSNRLSQNASCWCVTSQSEQQSSLSKCLMLVCYITKRAAIVSLKMPHVGVLHHKASSNRLSQNASAGVLHHKASSNRLSQNASCWCVTSQSEQQLSPSKCLALVCYITKRAAIVSLKMPHVGVLHRKASSNRLSQNASRWCVTLQSEQQSSLSQNASCWCVTSQSEQQSSLSKCLMLVCYIAKRAAIVSLKMPHVGVLHHKASSYRLSQNASCWCVTLQSEQQSSLSKCLVLVCYITKRAAIVSLKMPHVGVLHHKASSYRLSQNASCWCVHCKASSNRLSQNASRWCVTSQSEQQSSLSKCLMLMCYIAKRAAIVSLSKCLMLVCYITKRAAIVSLKMPHVAVLHHKASSNRLSQNASC